MPWIIPEDLDPEQVLTDWNDAVRALKDARERRDELEETHAEYVALCQASSRVVSDLREQVKFVKHLAEGKCASLIAQGGSWSRTDVPCRHKAKPGSRFCGVHRKRHE